MHSPLGVKETITFSRRVMGLTSADLEKSAYKTGDDKTNAVKEKVGGLWSPRLLLL